MSWNEEWRDAISSMTELDRAATHVTTRSAYGMVGDLSDAYDDIDTWRAS